MVQEKSNNSGELYCDERMFGVKRWYIGKPENANMRIPDYSLDSVCFICVVVKSGNSESLYFIGTGFFVAVPSSIQGKAFHYLVGARHVIEGAKAAGYSEFFIRLNTKDGKSFAAFIGDDWLYPENPSVDVVVLPLSIHEPSVKYGSISIESFVGSEALKKHEIGIGDELAMVGLFNQRSGYQRNIPIVRTGVIASMPEEPFVDDDGHLYEAYLVEIRSIGGLSGSPVFLYLDPLRTSMSNTPFDIDNLQFQLLLLGVIRGHWDLHRQDAASDSAIPTPSDGEIDRLNTGIAQVTPIQEVLAIINREELVKERQEKEKAYLRRNQPTLDSNLSKNQIESEGVTHEDFQDALKRASRKIEPKEEKDEA